MPCNNFRKIPKATCCNGAFDMSEICENIFERRIYRTYEVININPNSNFF